ncbi:hypothetical protein B0T26DRAFT_813475 [Lasiosphaeria miniovina]|uniref:Uncharacterized protein n=1 Tax=Lasiosphaeria miniovina TaxID=1954250 RepID=A0AA40DU61_9PEZI|nr:uncharacterized protein B0T26DRAFT_813475 [Lasiosphaeria miniovina]KAK0713512.1 hypothetical protein B0T26DRAFT_813475 [Lasiosphaeria miniovina]
MSPKRSSPSGSSAARRSRSSTKGTASEPEAAEVARDRRWAKVSGSANIHASYYMMTQNPLNAYTYVIMCGVPFDAGGPHGKVRCDGRKKCLYGKLAADHPEQPWKVTRAGKWRFFDSCTHCDLRNPDAFEASTFNDHEGYGVIEMFKNLFLDFEAAAGNYKEQIDDGNLADATFQLLSRMLMSTLAHLEREGLLAKDSEILNLGTVMGLFMMVASDMRDNDLLESSKAEALGPAKDKKSWVPSAFDNQILAYARKYDIALAGPANMAKYIAEAKANVDLPVPASNTGPAADPFSFAKALKAYKTLGNPAAFILQMRRAEKCKSKIGGDVSDFTSWKSAERAKVAFRKKDPLGREEIAAVARGDIMSIR